jgi:hypothetical protein
MSDGRMSVDPTTGELHRRLCTVETAIDSMNEKLSTWVNPVLAVVISVLCALLGFAGGVIAVLSRG